MLLGWSRAIKGYMANGIITCWRSETEIGSSRAHWAASVEWVNNGSEKIEWEWEVKYFQFCEMPLYTLENRLCPIEYCTYVYSTYMYYIRIMNGFVSCFLGHWKRREVWKKIWKSCIDLNCNLTKETISRASINY